MAAPTTAGPGEQTRTAPEWFESDLTPGPPLPLGRRVTLVGRGRSFVREVPGPEGARTVLLIHGWCASGGLNWFQAFDQLGEHFRVLAPDLRGHGRGLRTRARFRLTDCADDLAALIDETDAGPVIAVGYSMGGPIAQLLWKRHRDKVAGLVLCATGTEFMPGNRERYAMTSLMTAAASTMRFGELVTWLPHQVGRRVLGNRTPERPPTIGTWARAEFRRHDLRMVMEAGHAISTFSSRRWVRRIDVPTSVLITTRDRAVSPTAQSLLALSIPNAHINRIDDTHLACASPDFGRKLTNMCVDVDARIALAATSDPLA